MAILPTAVICLAVAIAVQLESRLGLLIVLNLALFVMFLSKPILLYVGITGKWLGFPRTYAEWIVILAVFFFLNWLALSEGRTFVGH